MNLSLPPLSVRETGDHLGVSDSVVRYLLRSRQLEGFKVSGAWRVTRAGLQDYIIRQLAQAR